MSVRVRQEFKVCPPGGGGGYGFSAVLVIDRTSILAILAILVINGVWFLHSSLDMGMFLSEEEVTFHHY